MSSTQLKMSWSIGQVWNEALETGREREAKSRQHIWASEIGGSYIDRFLRMKGIEQTNPPNARSLRKFEAGNMMEWVVGMVLKRAGIYKATQEYLTYQYPDLLKVTGKLDFLAGGSVDWDKAKAEIFQLELPEFFARASTKIIEYLSATYPNGLDNIILEVKSCSSFMFDRYERTGAGIHHQLQAYHYLKAKNLPEAHIVYISRDDLRMLEFGLHNPSPLEDLYRADIRTMTEFITTDSQPEKEPLVVYEEATGRFTRNWKVAYSGYLSMLYGYENQMSYENTWSGKVSAMNRVMARCVSGAKMTPKNLEIIVEAKKLFPHWDQLVENSKAKGVTEEDLIDEN